MRSAAITVLLLLPSAVLAADAGRRCSVPADAEFTFRLDRVPVEKAVVMMADLTCKTFVVQEGAAKVPLTVATPRDSQHTPRAIYAMFLAALRQQGLEAAGEDPVTIRKVGSGPGTD